MATRFKVWIDNPVTGQNGNIQDYTTFNTDSQRANGFAAGTAASSVRVNTALRTATLIASALMSVIAPDSELDASASVTQVANLISTYMSGITSGELSFDSSTNTLTLGDQSVDLSGILNGTAAKATADANGNVISDTYATKEYVANAIGQALLASY